MSAIAARPLRILALVLVASLGVAAPAAASGVRTTLTLHLSPDGTAAYFYGLVRSGKPACVAGRSVRIQVSPTGTDGWLTMETVTTNRDGTWSDWVGAGMIAGGYYRAVAPRARVGSADCRPAVAKTLFVD